MHRVESCAETSSTKTQGCNLDNSKRGLYWVFVLVFASTLMVVSFRCVHYSEGPVVDGPPVLVQSIMRGLKTHSQTQRRQLFEEALYESVGISCISLNPCL